MKNSFFYLLLVFISCNNYKSKDDTSLINKLTTSNRISVINLSPNNFLIPLFYDTLEIISSEKTETATIKSRSSDTLYTIPFYFLGKYFSSAYLTSSEKKSSNFIILQSNIPGSTGIGASILNITIIQLRPAGSIMQIINYESVRWGAELISFSKDNIKIGVLGLGPTSRNLDTLCYSSFIFDNNFNFVRSNNPKCISYKNNMFLELSDSVCECETISAPMFLINNLK